MERRWFGIRNVHSHVEKDGFDDMKDLLVFGVPRRDTLRKKLYVKSKLFRGEMEHEELWQVEQERNRPDDGNRYNGSTRLRLIAQWEADCVPAIYRNECEREDGNRYADSLWREIEKKKISFSSWSEI